MNHSHYQIGPQGQQVYNPNNNNQYLNLSKNPKFQIPTALDYLLYEIANPKQSTSADKIYSYLAYYYPKLTNSGNIELLTTHFLKCPIFFDSIDNLTIDKLTKTIECFQYILITKYKISNPTIPFHEFYSSIYKSCCYFLQSDPTSYWKLLPILGGCISAISFINNYNPYPDYSNIISRLNKLYIKLFSDSFLSLMQVNLDNKIKDPYLISLLYTEQHLSNNFYSTLLKTNPRILFELMKILFNSEYGLKNGAILNTVLNYNELMKTNPALKQLNKWAFLYDKILKVSSKDVHSLHSISASLDCVVSFCKNISNEQLEIIYSNKEQWNFLKYIFFTIIIIFEYSTKFILQGSLKSHQFLFIISNQMLSSLFYLSYILDQIGTGGFDSYNFVFDSTTSLLNDYNPKMAQLLTNLLLNETPINEPKSVINESKIIYYLRIIEALLPSLTKSFRNDTLFPMIDKFFVGNSTPTEIEFCHSIMIKYLNSLHVTMFENNQEFDHHIQKIVFPYFNRVLIQFPKYLSLNQTSLIIQTCGKIVSPSLIGSNEVLISLIDSVKFHINLSALTPLPSRKTIVNGNEETYFEKLQTRKAGMILFYLDLLQFISLPLFLDSLNKIKGYIDSLKGDNDIYSLYDTLWDKLLLINKYDCQKGQIGIDWWYDTVNYGLVPKL